MYRKSTSGRGSFARFGIRRNVYRSQSFRGGIRL